MNLDELMAEVQRRADDRLDDVIVRILTADIPEPTQVNCCPKCGPLLREYIRCKIALHRFRRLQCNELWIPSASNLDCTIVLRVKEAKAEFHAIECSCGLQLWRGRKWRARQSHEYQERWQTYVSQNN